MRPLKIDTHLHTRYSGSSSLAIETLVQNARDTRQRVVVCTDHADDHAYDRLRRDLPRTLVIPAIEVEAEESDLLVYSADRDYIHSLCDFHGSIKELRRDEKTAIVWAHPCVSQRADLSHLRFAEQGPYESSQEEFIALIARHVDGIEVCNGTMLSLAACGLLRRTYFDNLRLIADRFHLARTGGSDAHERETLSTVWTEFDEPVETVRDFIDGLKSGRTRPGYDCNVYPTAVGPDL